MGSTQIAVVCMFMLAVGCGSARPRAQKVTEKAKSAAGKAIDVVYGTPTPTSTPVPTPTPVFAPTILQVFPEASGWRPPPYPEAVIGVAFRVLTATEPRQRRGPPRLSQDGRFIAYDEGEGLERRLIIRRTSTGEVTRKISLPETAGAPSLRSPFAWSPSSAALVFTRTIATGGHGLFIVELDGAERLLLTEQVKDGEIAWSPTGERIAFVKESSPGAIWLTSPTGTETTRATETLAPVRNLSFSPDGAKLAFAAGTTEHDIYVASQLETPTPLVTRLTRWYFDDVLPSWSPDGRSLAFYSTYNPEGALRRWSLFVIRSDGRDPASGAALAQRMVIEKIETDLATSTPWLTAPELPMFIKEAERGYFALWAVDPARRDRWRIDPETRVNRNVMTTPDGLLAFRAQKEWAEHIVIGLLYAPSRPYTRRWP